MLCPLRLEVDPLEASSPAIVDAAMLKRHLRIDTADDDSLLDLYVQAAVEWCEGATHRTIVRRGHVWVLAGFEDCPPYRMVLPRGQTQAVTGITYRSNGEVIDWSGPSSSPAGSDYQEDLRGEGGGVLMPLRGGTWPSVDSDVPAPVEIAFSAGWAGDDIPAELRHAILFAVADCYAIRETADFQPGLIDAAGPRYAARQSLISSWMLPRIY